MASASKAKIRANRQNAKRSTGPKTIQGKLKVSQNAITHGIFATTPLLPHENATEFAVLSQSIAEVYPPVDAIAAGLVERIILAIWRQKRLRIAEAAKLQISMTPEIMAEEINEALKLPFTRRLTAQSISEDQESTYIYWKEVVEEFDKINIKATPKNLVQLSTTFPKIYYQLKNDALNAMVSYDEFMKNPDKIIASLEKTKKYAKDFVAANAINHTAYNIAEQMKLAKLIPAGANLDFLCKYQVQLDTDLYRAIEAYKKHCAWRMENIEMEVVEEKAEA
jgi:hypothetical protein